LFMLFKEVRAVNAARLKTPIEKVRELQGKLGHASKANRRRRFHALYDKVYRMDVLLVAWEKVRANKGAAGIDRQTLADIETMGVQEFLLSCQQDLIGGKYHPQPVRRKYIPKKDGKKRPLGIPTVRDRVIQMAVKLVVEPIFEADFKDCSFGFRPGRSAKQALERVRKACNRKGNWVVDVDIQGYFDNINQEKLMKLVQMRISDRRVLKLIRKWLQAGVMEEGKVTRPVLGTPQGGVISPLLANIYLHYFDHLWEKNGATIGELTRYADDLIVVCRTKKDADRALQIIQAIMKRLELTLHPEKTKIVGMWTGKTGFDFLGMHHRKTKTQTAKCKTFYTTQQWLTRKAEQHIRDVIKERLAPPAAGIISVREHVEFLNPKIRGWRNYYKTSTKTPTNTSKLYKLDWYILNRFSRYYARKTKKRNGSKLRRHIAKLLQWNGLQKLATAESP